MAITASGFYGLSLEKFFNDGFATSDQSLEAEDKNVGLTGNAASQTPNFDTHNFRDDITENAGSGYSAGGIALTGTELTVASGTLTYDATLNPSWASSTITAAASFLHAARGGASSADEIFFLHYFGLDVSSGGGTFTITWHTNGLFTLDYTP